MLTSTERSSRTRLRLSLEDGARSRVRSATTLSDPSASSVRPMLLSHDAGGARVSLVPDGALLLGGDAIELDIEVGPGACLDLVEPGGTVAFDMRGGRASWSVLVTLGPGARLTWAGEPFIVSAGADVRRTTVVRMAQSATLAMRETLVLGRHGESPGRILQHTAVSVDREPVLVEELPLDDLDAAILLGGHRVLASVLAVGEDHPSGPEADRFDLDGGARLWRRLGTQAHETELVEAWRAVS